VFYRFQTLHGGTDRRTTGGSPRSPDIFGESKQRELRDKLGAMEQSRDSLLSEVTEATGAFVDEVRDMAELERRVFGVHQKSSRWYHERYGGHLLRANNSLNEQIGSKP